MRFSEIKRFPTVHYRIDVPLGYVLDTLARYTEDGLNMNPDFQRGYVWTKRQQIAYVEYLLKEPTSGREIYFNHPGWMSNWKGDFVLVDGLQRLTAVTAFLTNSIKVYGHFIKDFQDKIPIDIALSFSIAKLQTRKEVLEWYLDFNTGGTYHTEKEIAKVKTLIAEASIVTNSIK